MVDAAIKTGKCSETVKFVENYPSVMNISPTRVALYTPRLVSYVAEVLEKSRSLLQDGKQKESEDYASLAMVLMGLLPDQSGVMADANYSLDRLGRANGAVPGVTDFSHTLDRAKVTAAIDQFNKMKEEGKVMTLLRSASWATRPWCMVPKGLPAPPTSLSMNPTRMLRAGRITCIIWQ